MIRVYRYGLHPPAEQADRVCAEMRGAHRLYNEVVAIYRRRRRAIRGLDSDDTLAAASEVERLVDAQTAVRQEIRDARAGHGTVPTQLKRRAAELGQSLAAARERLRQARRAQWRDPARKQRARAIDRATTAAIKAARRGSGVYWGTYNKVCEEARQADQTTQDPRGPRFRRWRGEGAVRVQIQSGSYSQDAELVSRGDHPLVSIDPVDPRAHDDTTPKGERRRLRRTHLRMRIACDHKVPVIAVWPMVYHRPLPVGGRVVEATVTRRYSANRPRWSVSLTVDEPEPDRVSQPRSVVALNVGWRRAETGDLRVAYWCDDTGRHGELACPASVPGQLDQADRLRSHRDQLLDELRAGLQEDLHPRDALHPDLREHVRALAQWRSPARFVGLLRRYRDELPHDARTRLQAWHRRDLHLWQYESGARRRAVARRDDWYRKIAADLSERYDAIVMGDWRHSRLGEHPAEEDTPERTDDEAATERRRSRQRVRAASRGRLLESVVQAGVARGRIVLRLPLADRTRTCYECGQLNDVGEDLYHRCGGCGIVWDQDHNFARNLLASGLAVLDDPGSLDRYALGRSQRAPKWSRGSQDGSRGGAVAESGGASDGSGD